MSERRLRLAVAALALVGAAIAAYLTVVHYDRGALVCPTSGCETVQRSAYATIGGVPVALLGLLSYLLVLGTALRRELAASFAGAVAAAGGAVFSLYLVGVQIFSLHAVCAWCLASDGVLSLLAVAAVARLALLPAAARPAPAPPPRPKPRASAAGSRRGTRTTSRSRPGSRGKRAR